MEGVSPNTAPTALKRAGTSTGDAIGQRDHRADTGDRHQAPAHIIVADDSQQAAMQDAELLANNLPDNEQWFHQHGQIGKALDKLPNTRLELDRPDHADLETEVAQVARRSFSMAMAFD